MTATAGAASDDRRREPDPHVTYVLRLADDNLVLAQRYAEWISNAPELEEDIALANIGLDHLGQSRALLTHAARLEEAGRDEDDLAMFRSEREFTNLLLVERENGDFAHTMVRALLFDAFQVELWTGLQSSTDETLAGIAAKAVKEASYHLRHSSAWVTRLGDGTDESRRRTIDALESTWSYTGEMFEADHVDRAVTASGVGLDPQSLASGWRTTVDAVLTGCHLTPPDDPYQRSGGRAGRHTEALGHLLTEMQWMQRSYPGLAW